MGLHTCARTCKSHRAMHHYECASGTPAARCVASMDAFRQAWAVFVCSGCNGRSRDTKIEQACTVCTYVCTVCMHVHIAQKPFFARPSADHLGIVPVEQASLCVCARISRSLATTAGCNGQVWRWGRQGLLSRLVLVRGKVST